MQGMRAGNNNNMRNPSLHLLLWGYACYYCCMPCLAAYILPSSPVLLHIYCTCFSTFLALSSLHPSTFNGNVFTPFIVWVSTCHHSYPVLPYPIPQWSATLLYSTLQLNTATKHKKWQLECDRKLINGPTVINIQLEVNCLSASCWQYT